MAKKDQDQFDIQAAQIVAAYQVSDKVKLPLSRHVAQALRHTHRDAQEDIRDALRTILLVPSTEDVNRAIDGAIRDCEP